MLLELKLERVGNSNLIQAEALRNINLHIKLSKNKARIRIFDQVSDNNINKINNNNNVNNNINNNNNNNFDKSGSGYAFPTSLFDTEDLEMANDGKIEDLSESNISIQIINHPFSFALYRKDTGERLFDTTHSNESSIFDHYLFYAKNYIQISTRLTKGHFTYGLGERFTSLRLKNGKYVHWSAERTGSPVGQESLENYYSAIPAYMTVNPDSGNACGVFMMNSSPSEVVLEDSYLTFKMISGNIDLFVFSGPRPREVVQQFQNTFGLPLVPPYSAMNWHANMISNQLRRDLLAFNSTLSSISRLLPVETLWIDHQVNLDTNNLKDSEVILQSIKEQGLAVFIYKQSPLSVNSNLFETAKNRSILITKYNGDIFEGRSSYGNVCFLDYFSHNAHDFIITEFVREPLFKYNISAVTLYKNEPAHNCDGDCKSPQKNKFVFSPGQDKNYILEEQTLPLNAKQAENGNSLLNTHNLYSLQETRTYFHALTDSGISRPLIFSRSVFFGNQQYAGKWLGHLESSWKGLQLALIQTLNFNVRLI
jgi:alpha-glucosidase (family GH31 glycosyl hydrolase)